MINLGLSETNIFKNKTPAPILYLLIVAVVFNLLRVLIWGKISFVFILWNLFLAFIPFVISFILLGLHKNKILNIAIFVIGSLLWLIFIPNAPYLVTDLIHIGEAKTIPILFDTILLFSSAYLGIILFFNSLSHVEEITKSYLSKKMTNVVIVALIVLISFGIYLGRFLRFNSWDIFVNHHSLIKNVWKIFTENSTKHWNIYWFTLMFSFFLFFTYKSWKSSNIKDSKD